MNTHDGAFFAGVTTDDRWYERNCVDALNSPEIIVFVERIVHAAVLGNSKEIWLKIRKPGSLMSRGETLRVADENDRRILLPKYPSFFHERFNGPARVLCMAEWLDGAWCLARVKD